MQSAYAQSRLAVTIEDIYLAKDDGTGHAGEAATTFLPTDIPIYCVVQLDSSEPATVKMNLIAENVPGVKADTKVVSTTYRTQNGENRVNFYGKPYGKWTPGRYRADIYVEEKLLRSVKFDVVAPSNVASKAPGFVQRKSNRPVSRSQKKPYAPFSAQFINR
jgi:hypothetical protein